MSNAGLLAISAELKRVDKAADGMCVRVCLLDLFAGGYRLAGWHEVEGPEISPKEVWAAREFGLIRAAVQGLGENLGRDLWDDDQDRPLVESADPVRRPPLGQVAALASPLPRLRLWLAGLTPAGLNMAVQAASSGPTQILGSTRLTRHSHPTQITEIVARHRPQVLLISGGQDLADPAAHEPVLALCNLIGRGLEAVPPSQRPTLLYAGSAPARPAAELLLAQTGGRVRMMGVENLHPAPGILRLSATAQALHRLHGSLSQRLPAMQRLSTHWVTGAAPVEGVDWGFARLARLWAAAQDLPHLHGLYCGPTWWLHVWEERPSGPLSSPVSSQEPLIRLLYTEPGARPKALDGWPPLKLVCGEWPQQIWPRPTGSWLDSLRLAPAVAALAQTETDAVVQVLARDLLNT
ncbi:MAG: glutamate mutase L [Caldilineaceae bacterium]|nr:glutamate mutase L [Caldilineaceae bacterium]